MAKNTLTLQVSVMDSEPVVELVDIICSYPRDQLPDDLRQQLEEWCDKHTSEDD